MKKISTVITVLVLLAVFNPSPAHALMVLNNTQCIFDGQCDPDSGQSVAMIKADIVSGAAYYLESHANILMFLNKVELSQLNSPDIQALSGYLDLAVEQMEKARAAYFNLKSMASETSYNSRVTKQLEGFDYLLFRSERGLNPSLFRKVTRFLKRGDVRGVYNKFYRDVEAIVIQLYEIKYSLDLGTLPQFPQLYRLNQTVSEVQLFGQYVTEVVNSIKK